MRILPLATVLFVSSFASSAFAQDRSESPWYIGFDLGALSVTDIDQNPTGTVGYDTGVSMALALGRHLIRSDSLDFSGELEGLYAFTKLDDGDLVNIPSAISRDYGNLAWFVNGVLDWKLSEDFGWYGGAGVGYASGIRLQSFDSGNLAQADTQAIAFQFKLGAIFHMGGRYDFLLGYRYFQTEDVQIDNLVTLTSFDVTNQANIFEAGVRWGL